MMNQETNGVTNLVISEATPLELLEPIDNPAPLRARLDKAKVHFHQQRAEIKSLQVQIAELKAQNESLRKEQL